MRKEIIKTVVLAATLSLFFALSHPDQLPAIGLIIPFILLAILFYNVWVCVGTLRLHYAGLRNGSLHKRLGLFLSIGSVLLIVLQSLGQLTIRDVITVSVLFVLGYAYFTRAGFVIAQTPRR